MNNAMPALPAGVPAAAPVCSRSTPAGSGLGPAEIGSGDGCRSRAAAEACRHAAAFRACRRNGRSGKPGDRHLETFNADNLYEKIDGRAESFIQYGVKGMAYAFYHPTGDPSNELQLYVFEMADSLKALGKYGSEKPEEFQTVSVGDAGYTSAGSLLFHAGRYYTQIVSTKDDPKFAAFALDLAKRVAAVQQGGPAAAGGDRGRAAPVINGRCTGTSEHEAGCGRAGGNQAGAEGDFSRDVFCACCRPRGGMAIPSMSRRTFSAIASYPTSSWPITKTRTSPGRGFFARIETSRKRSPCLRNTSRASRKTGPRSKLSQPTEPMRWS